MNRASIHAFLATVAMPIAYAQAADLVVHEWGTFTSFQDADGRTIAGLNVDDEPVPKFVHRLKDMPIFTVKSPPANWSQGAPMCHADVTMRLETPVLYFYPQAGFDTTRAIDVSASFVGGWLTEFFPQAAAEASKFPGTLDSASRSKLSWAGLRLVPETKGWESRVVQTDERVWLAPRRVGSAIVVDRDQHAEKYLFYRGVGHLDAPLVVRQQTRSLTMSLRDGSMLDRLPAVWVVQVTPDGRVQYTSTKSSEKEPFTATASTPTDDGSTSRLDALRGEIAAVLRAEGLYEDEARAMLDTWRLSYFESEGLRLFFLLPRSWTDARLPLSISTPADTVRVMLGRIELVSAHQRSVLRKLLALPDAAFELPAAYTQSVEVLRALQKGIGSHAEYYRMMGKDVPEALQLYDSLGRFRDALLAYEIGRTPDDATRQRLNLIMSRFSACLRGKAS
jgi:hypothetical protein